MRLFSAVGRRLILSLFLLLIGWGLKSPQMYGQERAAASFQGGMGFSITSYQRDVSTVGSLGFQHVFSPRFYDLLALQVGLGWEFLGPHCVGQETICPTNNSRTLLLFGSLAVGLFTPRLYIGNGTVDLALGIYAGREWVHGRNGLKGCINCLDDQLKLQGGYYLEPTLEVFPFADYGMSLAYRGYSTAADPRGRFVVSVLARTN